MCVVEPWPITARWRRCEEIREYALTLGAKERKAFLKKAVSDYVAFLVKVGVAPEKIEKERLDMERLITPSPDNGGTRLRLAA